jgi:small subunit ribosomal protein S11
MLRIKRVGNTKITKRVKVRIPDINTTFDNTIVTIIDLQGDIISWSSAVSDGFKVGIAYIDTTLDHTILTITDLQGDIISCSSESSISFKGVRKETSFTAYITVGQAIRSAYRSGIRKVEVQVKEGLGSREELVIEQLRILGMTILSIRDVTPIPHNGCQ